MTLMALAVKRKFLSKMKLNKAQNVCFDFSTILPEIFLILRRT